MRRACVSGWFGRLLILCAAAPHLGGCGSSHHHHEDEHGHGAEAIAVTQWGESTELFAEYSPLTVGAVTETAIHVTRLADFSAVTSGSLTVTLSQSDGTAVAARAEEPARPGIFTPSLTPTIAGPCQLTIVITGAVTGAVTDAEFTDTFIADSCQVASPDAAASPPGDDQESGISFLKEQQWNIDFATVSVDRRPMRETVRLNAQIEPVTGREAHLTAALGGRVQFADTVPVLGMSVAKGQLLARVTPPLTGATNRATLQAEVAAAQAEVDGARDENQRVKKLAQAAAIAERTVREVGIRLSLAESHLKAAKERLREYDITASGRISGSNTFRVRSPIAGTLVAVSVTSGETVDGGAHLFTVIDMNRLWVVGQVFEPDIPTVVDARSARFTVEGHERPFVILRAEPAAGETAESDDGRLITVGQVLDPRSRTVPIVFEVKNRDQLLRIGQFAELEIAAGQPAQALAVPTTAVLSDAGRQVVFVQRAGETFERRFVRTGLRSAGWVQILAGIEAGERVVSRGAHIVKLAASASSAPAHGHAH